MKQKIKQFLSSEIIRYLIFGVLTTIVSYFTYLIARYFDISPVIANVISWIISVTFAYITNRKYVFENKCKGKLIFSEILSFYLSRVFSGVVETAIIWFFSRYINDLIVKAAATVIVVILNYILSKFFVFNNKNNKKTHP
ncbi:MAG: GtrA family protein [Oscillospiraceae bacterium]